MNGKEGFRFIFLVVVGLLLLLTTPAAAQRTQDFGGFRYGGAGDTTAPRCQVSHPTSATSGFFISWFCVDDLVEQGVFEDGIFTSIWIRRPGGTRFEKIDDFLDFPASLFVDEFILQDTFDSGLPATFVIVARDRAGMTTISDRFTITNRDNDVDRCTLSVTTRATEADGGTTGLPSMNVTLSSVNVFTQNTSNDSFTVSMFRKEIAVPCEISELCSDDDQVEFAASVTVDADGSATGRIEISPNDVAENLTGTGSVSGSTLDSVDLSGTTVLEGTVADISLSCSQGSSSSSSSPDTDSDSTDSTTTSSSS